MQPFERLRAAVRWSSGLDEWSLLAEAIECLAGFDEDPAGLVIACRRLLAHHPSVARLWWLCSRVITAIEPSEAAWSAWDQLELDATASRLAEHLPADERPVLVLGWCETVDRLGLLRPDLDLRVVRTGDDDGLSLALRHAANEVRVHAATEAAALEASALLIPVVVGGGGEALVADGAHAASELLDGMDLLAVAPFGRVLAAEVFDAFRRANPQGPWMSLDLARTTGVVGPTGVQRPAHFSKRRDAPPAAELLRAVG
ncbi:MAG: hypothetical protein ACKO2C_05940 [Actinomycetes bacterium]